ncbi:MAG: VanZ family protein [Bacteroidales bacterium]|nr:VanZ family protein [Bacteroidales bacterium]
MKKILVFWKTVTWTVFMLVLFLIPSQDIPGSREIPNLDKVVHVAFFMIFTFLFMRDLLKIRSLKSILPVYIITTILVVLFIAIMIELLQDNMNLGRDGDINDILYDLAGFILGMLLLILKYGVRFRSL